MIRDAYVMLAQEPWCMTPDAIGRLTDWQIEHLYARPAAERAKIAPGAPRRGDSQLGARRKGSTGPPGEPGSAEHRSACIGAYMNVQGLNREQAERQYEGQLAAYRADEAAEKGKRP